MLESRSAVFKMLKNQAYKNRQISVFPRPYRLDATPYVQTDFSNETREICGNKGQILMTELKISKAIFLGDVAVGKTCLVNRFCHEVFDNNYKATIGVDFEVERFDILNIPFNLQIWDTAGQERFKCIASSYYRCAHVVAIIFDLTNLMSLSHCPQWLQEALAANTSIPNIFLVGTKRDLIAKAAFSEVEKRATTIAKSLNAEFWAVSSRTGEGVQELFNRMAALAFDNSVLREREACTSVTLSLGSDLVSLKNNKTVSKPKKFNQKCQGCPN